MRFSVSEHKKINIIYMMKYSKYGSRIWLSLHIDVFSQNDAVGEGLTFGPNNCDMIFIEFVGRSCVYNESFTQLVYGVRCSVDIGMVSSTSDGSTSNKVMCFRNTLMMTSSSGNIFRVTDPLCGKFIGNRWIPRAKASDAEVWCFRWSAPE